MGTNTTSGADGIWRRISMPTGPWPAITGIVEGQDEGQLLPPRQRLRVGAASPGIAGQHHLHRRPAVARTASTFTCGAVCGTTMVARTPSRAAEIATPWAWLPADAVITPWSSAACGVVFLVVGART